MGTLAKPDIQKSTFLIWDILLILFLSEKTKKPVGCGSFWKLDQLKRVLLSWWNKNTFKTELFNYHHVSDVMWLEKWGKCHSMWVHHYFLCCESVLVQMVTFFMAVICGMAKGRKADHRYFLESVYDWIKTDCMWRKVGSSYLSMLFIVCWLMQNNFWPLFTLCVVLYLPTKGKALKTLQWRGAQDKDLFPVGWVFLGNLS